MKAIHRPLVDLDSHQTDARRAGGVFIPPTKQRTTEKPEKPEKRVGAIVTLECEHCGCTYAKPLNGKPTPCTFCGRRPRGAWGESNDRFYAVEDPDA